MCIAIVKPSGSKVPDRDILKICFKNNPDGAGFAYCRKGKNYLFKGFFTFKSFWDAFSSANIKKNEAALIHFRVATHGNIDKHTCHPFIITNNYEDMRETSIVTENGDIMIHNGILNFDFNNDDISDSMYLAKYLSKFDLSNPINSFMFELALLNNNKNKFNRVGILHTNNKTEIFGFKEPWELYEGCYFSNKSYTLGFSRTYSYSYSYSYSAQNVVTDFDRKEKLEYNEEEIQSKKISFCNNHKNGCDEIGIYAVHTTDKDYDVYCEKCINDVNYFNCKCCNHTCYKNNESQIKNICTHCYNNNNEFLINSKCFICEYKKAKHLLSGNTNNKNENIALCEDCFNAMNPFKCADCEKYYAESDKSEIKNLCINCYLKTNNAKKCTYCSTTVNLLKSNYSIICEKCFKEKSGKVCFVCEKPYIWGDDKIGELNICPTCARKSKPSEIVLDNFKSYHFLNEKVKSRLKELFKNASDKNKMSVLNFYKENNFFDKINDNANDAIDKLKENNIERVVL